jgi:hypothetical protein
MSGNRGGNRVDAANAEYDACEDPDVAADPGREPLTRGAIMFWILVVFLALIGICVLVALILALVKGS